MRALIYFKKSELSPVGGPRGYLYNLKVGLDENNIENIDFLPEDNKEKEKKIRKILSKIFNFIMPIKIKKIRINSHLENNYKNLINKNNKTKLPLDYKKYDIIHFHSTFDLYYEQMNLKDYNGKIVLTSHSPEPLHQEIFKRDFKNLSNSNEILKELEKVDIYAFNRANYIFFPCVEAEEPYYNRWDKYKEIHDKNINKYRYILTGIKKCSSMKAASEVRKEYKIPKEAFTICYIGRHNEVKGYEFLKCISKKIMKDKNNYFLIAGKEGPIYGYKNLKQWTEIGWTKDPYSIINAADIFILPNKETYFDLVFLEVLSLKKLIVANNTGGNRYFEKFNNSGIYLYNNELELLEILEKIKNMNPREKKEMEIKNGKIFEDNFNEKKFAKNYDELLKSIL